MKKRGWQIQRQSKQAGFSLVELMLVVGIISLLSQMAMPRFSDMSAKAKQTEAKTNIKHIQTLAHTYMIENSTYAGSVPVTGKLSSDTGVCTSADFCYVPNGLGFKISNCNKIRYNYSFVPALGLVQASEINNLGGGCFKSRQVFSHCPPLGIPDTWSLNVDSGDLVHIDGKC